MWSDEKPLGEVVKQETIDKEKYMSLMKKVSLKMLRCGETEEHIIYGDGRLMVGTRGDVDFYRPLSHKVIKRIPKSKRRKKPCEPGDNGVDVHFGIASMGAVVSIGVTQERGYWEDDFKLGGFSFSVSRTTAAKYLPMHSKQYPLRRKKRPAKK